MRQGHITAYDMGSTRQLYEGYAEYCMFLIGGLQQILQYFATQFDSNYIKVVFGA